MRDYYLDARSVGRKLKQIGHETWHDRIEEAIVSGSTSGEILMAVRSELNNALKQIGDLPQSLVNEIKGLVRAINETGV